MHRHYYGKHSASYDTGGPGGHIVGIAAGAQSLLKRKRKRGVNATTESDSCCMRRKQSRCANGHGHGHGRFIKHFLSFYLSLVALSRIFQ